MTEEITFIDLFAGGGGTSTGAYSIPGIKVIAAINHDETAIKTHEANHPETIHFKEDLLVMDEKRLPQCNVMWASLECTEHSKAKGGKEKSVGSFALGKCLPRYVDWCKPDILIVENVPEFVRWGELTKTGKRVKDKEGQEYIKWIHSIKELGYTQYDRKFLNAANYGCATKRIRYFGVFAKPDFSISWPIATHAEKENLFGLPKWIACKNFIDLENEGNSIFGRKTPLVKNTLIRLAGGIRKFAPEEFFIMKYYGTGDNCQSINKPLHTIPTKDRFALVKCEKLQFIQDHCHTPNYNQMDEPLRPQLTWQTKQLVTVEKQFYTRRFTNDYANQPLTKPAPTITTFGSDALVTAKFQFITSYFNSSGNPGRQNQSLHKPLNSVTTVNKNALVTVDAQLVDFDIKLRMLSANELAAIMGFPKGYFEKPGLKLSKKSIVKMVGNAVPVGMAKALIGNLVPQFGLILAA